MADFLLQGGLLVTQVTQFLGFGHYGCLGFRCGGLGRGLAFSLRLCFACSGGFLCLGRKRAGKDNRKDYEKKSAGHDGGLLVEDAFKEFVGVHFLVFGRNAGTGFPVGGIVDGGEGEVERQRLAAVELDVDCRGE